MMEKFIDSFRLKREREDYATIHETVERDIVFKGTNLWILIFAIFIASIGLNINSTAVIIGAMLISPLMGPIIGMGYSLATYDFLLLKRAIYNFSFAVVTGLVTSTIYFSITPLNEAHSELFARTSPSIYDVLIALFGGLAGIVAMSSKKKGNVIPGVAIATALMPPLCTAGYGIATFNGEFFFGAIYLFTINTVFIGVATLMTTRFLRFPLREQIDERRKAVANRWVTGLVFITAVPSIFFGYRLVLKDQFMRNSRSFVNNVTFVEGCYLLKSDIDPNKKEIRLVYGGKELTAAIKQQITERTKDFHLYESSLVFQQGFAVEDIGKELTQAENLKAEINRLTLLLRAAEEREDSVRRAGELGGHILRELTPLFPEIISCSITRANFFSSDTLSDAFVAVLVSKNMRRTNAERRKIEHWLGARLGSQRVRLFVEAYRP